MSAKLANIILMVVPPVALATVVYSRYLRNVTKQTQNALAQSTQVSDMLLYFCSFVVFIAHHQPRVSFVPSIYF